MRLQHGIKPVKRALFLAPAALLATPALAEPDFAAAIRADGRLAAFVRDRYSSWQGDLGRRILSRGINLAELHRLAHDLEAVEPVSGRQEMLEDIVNQITIRALR